MYSEEEYFEHHYDPIAWKYEAEEIRFEEFRDHYYSENRSKCKEIIQSVLDGGISAFLSQLHDYRLFLMDYALWCYDEIICEYEAREMNKEIEFQFERIVDPLEKAIRESNGHQIEDLLDIIAIEAGYSLKERQADSKLYENFVLHLIFPIQQINA